MILFNRKFKRKQKRFIIPSPRWLQPYPVTKAHVKREKSTKSYKTDGKAAFFLIDLTRRVVDCAKGATVTPPVTDHKEE